jgi:hypothetical protein
LALVRSAIDARQGSVGPANREKTDEFYMQQEDIEHELRHYRDQFELTKPVDA